MKSYMFSCQCSTSLRWHYSNSVMSHLLCTDKLLEARQQVLRVFTVLLNDLGALVGLCNHSCSAQSG